LMLIPVNTPANASNVTLFHGDMDGRSQPIIGCANEYTSRMVERESGRLA
jgi:hypothetical protein